jgi:hypothetical protein
MFGCEEVEKVVWNITMSSLFEDLTCPTTWTRKGKWLGIFPNEENPNLYVVFVTTQNFEPWCSNVVEELGIPKGTILYKVAPHAKILQHQPFNSTNPDCGIIKQMKILSLSKGSIRKRPFLMLWRKVSKLAYDPTRWICEDGRSLLNLSVAKGRKILVQPVMQPSKSERKGGPWWSQVHLKWSGQTYA